ncbi:unnamed protein product [Alternaria alternata]
MAAPGGRYFIQEKLKDPASHMIPASHNHALQISAKSSFQHSFQSQAESGMYSFIFSTAKDFEPIVEDLVKRDFKPPYDCDEYARAHFPQAEKLLNVARKADAKGEIEKASQYYLRASAIYRVARFPTLRSDAQREAWRLQKECCLKGFSLRPHPVLEINIPHTHGLPIEGDKIPIYYLVPTEASKQNRVLCLIFITGLDAYRTEAAIFMDAFRKLGIATIAIEVPGTGDCPASRTDPKSPDRLEYGHTVRAVITESGLRTHPGDLIGVVSQGGGCHHMFDQEWLNDVNHLEYPMDLAGALADKFGYGNDVEAFKLEASDKFSLLKDGTLDKPNCARLLLVNGTDDEVFPIDDLYLALQHGAAKEARFEAGAMHMGGTLSYHTSIKWLLDLFEKDADPAVVLQTLSFKSRY